MLGLHVAGSGQDAIVMSGWLTIDVLQPVFITESGKIYHPTVPGR